MDQIAEPGALLAELTLEEKAALCLGSDVWHTAPVPRHGIPAVRVSDGPHGLRVLETGGNITISGSLPATCFPTASALASSWDPDLVRRIGQAIGAEARAQDVGVVLGPGVNIKRSPLCGRNFEYFSEDPLVAGVLGSALVQGLQSQGIGASVKHYAANNQETDRQRISADVDERTLREIYLPAFERIVTEARPWTVMCAYNKINGVYASENRWLLTDVLRGEWGFEGVVVSDWGAVHDRVAALNAGLDLEMPPDLGVSDAAIVAAVRNGTLDEGVLDQAVLRVLQLVQRATATAPAAVSTGFDVDAHHALARATAAECAVLVKNDNAVLPLQPVAGDVIAVIGEFARSPRYQGGGSSQVNPTRVDVPLDELRAVVPDGVHVAFAPGFGIATAGHDQELAIEAVELAARADVVVAFVGLPTVDESEGVDRTRIELPDSQTALLEKLAAVSGNVVVVLANGSAVQLAAWEQHARAILECWLSGQAAGGAAADLLLGRANPSGRLTETLPLRLQDNTSYLNFPGDSGHVRYGEGVFVGYRGYDAVGREISYPFGHGLSYTRFDYTDLSTTISGSADDGDLAIAVTCTVTNIGQRAGKEVVQLYVADVESTVVRPVRELKGFAKIALEPGASKTIELMLNARDLSYWSSIHKRWLLEAGSFDISVGASSRDLRLTTTVDVSASPPPTRLDATATLQEWLAHPKGSVALRQAIGVGPDGRAQGILADTELQRVIGNFPIGSLASFPGVGINHAIVSDLLRRFESQ